MSKRNIAYVKPQDPNFLAKLKAEIGYKEGPTVETKRQRLEEGFESDEDYQERPERDDEKPLVVVLQSGDLTAEEAVQEEQRLAKAAAEAPADLSKPIVFKKRSSNKNTTEDKATEKLSKKKSKKNSKPSTSKLSFNEEDDEEDL